MHEFCETSTVLRSSRDAMREQLSIQSIPWHAAVSSVQANQMLFLLLLRPHVPIKYTTMEAVTGIYGSMINVSDMQCANWLDLALHTISPEAGRDIVIDLVLLIVHGHSAASTVRNVVMQIYDFETSIPAAGPATATAPQITHTVPCEQTPSLPDLDEHQVMGIMHHVYVPENPYSEFFVMTRFPFLRCNYAVDGERDLLYDQMYNYARTVLKMRHIELHQKATQYKADRCQEQLAFPQMADQHCELSVAFAVVLSSPNTLTSHAVRAAHLAVETKLMQPQREDLSAVALLTNAIENCASSMDCHRCIGVVNSTGFGKSKACYDLGLTRKVVYFLCADHGDMIVPPVVLDMVHSLCNADPSARTKCAMKILHCISLVAVQYASAMALHHAQFAAEGDFFTKLALLWNAVKDIPHKRKCRFAGTAGGPYDDGTGMVIVFDECSVLKGATALATDPLCCLIRAVNASAFIALFLSTDFSAVVPVLTKHDCPSVVLVAFVDMFKDHLFKLGRPLWNHLFNQYHENVLQLVKAVQLLLINKPTQSSAGEDYEHRARCALFCCRFCCYRPIAQVANYFVANHLATLVKVDLLSGTSASILHAKYSNEPVLAEASAHLTVTNPIDDLDVSIDATLATVVQSMNGGHFSLIEPSKVDMGAGAVSVALAYTMDCIRWKLMSGRYDPNNVNQSSFSAEIPLASLLSSILPAHTAADVAHLDGYVVNFSHVQQVIHLSNSQIALAYSRHAAILLESSHEACDIVIIARNSKASSTPYALLVVQVKTLHHSMDMHTAEAYLLASHSSMLSNVTNVNHNACVSLLVAAGGDSFEASKYSAPTFARKAAYPAVASRSDWLQAAITLHSFILLSESARRSIWHLANVHKAADKQSDEMKLFVEYGQSGLLSFQDIMR